MVAINDFQFEDLNCKYVSSGLDSYYHKTPIWNSPISK